MSRGAWRGPGAAPAGLAWAALLAALLGLAACSESPAERLARARALVDAQDRAGAIVVLKSVIQDEPELAPARLQLGLQLLDEGEVEGARIELERALALGQPLADVAPALARALLAAGQPRAVIGQFGDLKLPQAEAAAELYCMLAQAHATLDELPAARASLAQALQAVPGHAGALRLSARVAAVAGDPAGALKTVGELLARHPGNAEGWVLQGDLLAQRQAPPDAVIAAYRQALQVQARHAPAHAALISLYLTQRDTPAARSQLQALQQALPGHPQTALFEGQLAFIDGDLPRARDRFQTLLRGNPGNLVVLQLAAALELRAGAPVQAEALLSKALQLAPESASVRRLQARSLLSLGQAGKALSTLEPLLGKSSSDVEALQLAAHTQLLAGDAAAAAAALERARALRPQDPQLRTAAALARFGRGQVDSAIAELQAVAASDSGLDADLALISAELRRKSPDAALQAVAGLERKQAGKPLAPHLRGQVLLFKGDEAAARAAFGQALARDATYLPSVLALASLDLHAGQPERARARLDALIQAVPDSSAAYLAAAEVFARSGANREEVAGLLDRAVLARPGDRAARLALIDHHLGTQNVKAALDAAQAALTQLPDQADLLLRLGQAQGLLAEYQQAANTFKRLAALQPRSAQAPLLLAEAQAASGDLPAASRSARRALDLAPTSLAARKLAIGLALRQQQPAQATALARELQQLQPAGASGLVQEAEVEISQKHWDTALLLLRKAVALADPEQAPERLHHVLRLAGRTAEADQFAGRWQADHPRDALFLFYLGDLALAQKDHGQAEARYQAVLQLKPAHPLALNNIAWLRLQQGQPGALGFAERAVAAAPNNPALMDTLALALAADKQWPRAIALQLRALTLRPTDAFMRLNLARFYAQSGDKRQAKAELDRLEALGERFSRQAEVAALSKSLGGRP